MFEHIEVAEMEAWTWLANLFIYNCREIDAIGVLQ